MRRLTARDRRGGLIADAEPAAGSPATAASCGAEPGCRRKSASSRSRRMKPCVAPGPAACQPRGWLLAPGLLPLPGGEEAAGSLPWALGARLPEAWLQRARPCQISPARRCRVGGAGGQLMVPTAQPLWPPQCRPGARLCRWWVTLGHHAARQRHARCSHLGPPCDTRGCRTGVPGGAGVPATPSAASRGPAAHVPVAGATWQGAPESAAGTRGFNRLQFLSCLQDHPNIIRRRQPRPCWPQPSTSSSGMAAAGMHRWTRGPCWDGAVWRGQGERSGGWRLSPLQRSSPSSPGKGQGHGADSAATGPGARLPAPLTPAVPPWRPLRGGWGCGGCSRHHRGGGYSPLCPSTPRTRAGSGGGGQSSTGALSTGLTARAAGPRGAANAPR